MKPSLSQNFSASPNGTLRVGGAGQGGGRHGARPCIRSGFQPWLSPCAAVAPRVQRVIERQRRLQHGVVVGMQPRQAQRDRQQPGGLRRQVQPAGVGPAHDARERRQAQAPAGRTRATGCRSCTARRRARSARPGCRRHRLQPLRFLEHPFRRHIEELRARVDEAAQQPGTGDAVDLGALARDPARRLFAGHTQVGALAQGGQAALDHPSMPPCKYTASQPAARRSAAACWLTSRPCTQ